MWVVIFLFSLVSISDEIGNVRGFVTELRESNGVRASEICMSHGCKAAAKMVKDNMNDSVNPCDDFYLYACGGFISKHDIPADKKEVTSFSLTDEDLKMRIKAVIKKPKLDSEPKCFHKVKDVYAACMDTGYIDLLGSKPLLDLLRKVGGWPVVEGSKWNEETFDWVETQYKFRQAGISTDFLFDITVSKDLKNSTRRLISLRQPSFEVPGQRDLNKAYHQLMVNIAVHLGANKTEAEDQLMESLRFEIELVKFTLSNEERRRFMKLYNLIKVEDLSSTISSKINWLEYFNTILLDEIKPDEPVIAYGKEYIKNALEVISKTPKRTIANYLMWRVALTYLQELDVTVRSIYLEYNAKVIGQTEETSRWLKCMKLLQDTMPLALGSMYVRQFFNNDAKSAVKIMVENIRKAFTKNLKSITWMASDTKQKALDKLASTSEQIGYPDELMNNALLDEFYGKVSVKSDDHFGNYINLQQFLTNNSYSLLRKPFNKTDWKMYGDAAQVEAYYTPFANIIYFPAGFLQGVFYNQNRPQYLNYGSLGFAIGHELTHGFDDMGKKFDKFGNVFNWWDNDTSNMFEQKVACFIDQFNSYKIPGTNLSVNGDLTQGENIADSGGLKQAYNAYKKLIARNGPEPFLPGLQLTPKQLFWMSAANTWCSNIRPEYLAEQLKDDPHSPSHFRINGAFSNSKQFAKDFNCPRGSNMNPAKKCAVW